MVFTNETPETAVSPAPDTIIISAIPTDTERICSITNGPINATRNLLSSSFVCGLFYLFIFLMSMFFHFQTPICKFYKNLESIFGRFTIAPK